MAAITRRLLHLAPHPYSLRRFSSSSDIPQPKPESESPPQPSFSDVKASLEREPPPQNRPTSFSKPTPPPQTSSPSTAASFEELHRNLSQFRSRPAPSSPSSASGGQHISLQELFKRHVIPKDDVSVNSKPPMSASIDTIRNSLAQMGAAKLDNGSDSHGKIGDWMSLGRFQESFKLKPGQNEDLDSKMIFGGSDYFPSYLKEKSGSGGDSFGAMRSGFMKMYNYSELGAKLKMLRPDKKKGDWLSLNELKERLTKLREEEKESRARVGGISNLDLRETLVKMSLSEEEKKKKTMQRFTVLDQLGGTPSYMMTPPKDQLVEKYFHPDNMSSAEKMKLELKKVRDEFKMSESDCGSARVQVAQLTTKIKHLSTILQKKDKHSRKGLQAMVQRRKKLLKYLRRTDWDSYCLVLSKLGLRDNPDIKA